MGHPHWRSHRIAIRKGNCTGLEAVACLLHLSRALDDIEESSSCLNAKCCTSFRPRPRLCADSVGLNLTDPHDGVTVYYRSRPMMLALALIWRTRRPGPCPVGIVSDGRDIGLSSICRARERDRAAILW